MIKYLDSGVCAVSLHPGAVNTSIFRERDDKPLTFRVLTAFIKPFFYLFGKSSKEGAQTTIHCCISDDIPNQNGSYFE
jgi:retinol dehydrogenase-12